ncbi:cyclophilin-like fold protein [Priestia aryabhattai]|uniref:Cyclophilin-like fold protein n=1 Tax=Priestia aryabhattai TaxID=412384 RepID=A0AAX6N835_PRIAR|nr:MULTISPECIES: cyclophilin-like fold protein [Priestia]MDU9692051.1 cyclophilin-like fold protein [Priestia aryabhattai]SUV10516.1 putative lipoprotein [Priestia megaterium]
MNNTEGYITKATPLLIQSGKELKMRKLLCLTSILSISLALAACGNNNLSAIDRDHNANDNLNREPEQSKEDNISNAKIKLTFENKEVVVRMYDNPVSKDFLARLPLTATFEDYIGKEKISILQKRLSIDDVQAEDLFKKGDFAYYAPWGNVAIFHKDFEDATNDLIILGQIESGKENFENVDGTFTVRIEKVTK